MLEDTIKYQNILILNCECCRQNPISIKDDFSYCESCYEKLRDDLLSPRELYHLTALNGYPPTLSRNPVFDENIKNAELLFYSSNGFSLEFEFKNRKLSKTDQVPNLNEVKDNLFELLQYYFFTLNNKIDELFPFKKEGAQEIINALQQYEFEDIENCLKFILKNKQKYHVYYCCYELLFTLNNKKSASIIREHWHIKSFLNKQLLNKNLQNRNLPNKKRIGKLFSSFIRASLTCLTVEETFKFASDEMSRDFFFAKSLIYFPWEIAVPWLEKQILEIAEWSSFAWADAVGMLKVPWCAIEKWLLQGEPLSLLGVGLLTYKAKNNLLSQLHDVVSHDHMASIFQKVKPVHGVYMNFEWLLASFMKSKNSSLNGVPLPVNSAKNWKHHYPVYSSFYVNEIISKVMIRNFVWHKFVDMKTYRIKNFIKKRKFEKLETKFGGQPDWVDHPQWPLAKNSNQPMKFFGQIVIDKLLFPSSITDVVYLFVEDLSEISMEMAMVIQPGNYDVYLYKGYDFIKEKINYLPINSGESVSSDCYIPKTELVQEKNYIPDIDKYQIFLGEESQEIYKKRSYTVRKPAFDNFVEGKGQDKSKIGGLPSLINGTEYPNGERCWNFLFQLCVMSKLFDKFGKRAGDGNIYVYISPDGTNLTYTYGCS